MFGSNVTSSWANPQQNQQQQQQPGAFGQPSAFGSTTPASTFGSGGTFGQPAQQQPQANPMFGNLGASNTNTGTSSGFGAFGGGSNTTSGAFGAKPATGFGTFGSGGTFGGTSTFGQPSNTPSTSTSTGAFGQPATSTSTTGGFSGNTSLFNPKPSTGFGTATQDGPTVTTGTANTPYSPFNEKDNNVTLMYQAISCMPQYIKYSFEELRLQDYLQGRKTATSFGQPATFGTQPQGTSLFGTQPAQSTSIFGNSSTPANTGFSAFSQSNTTQPAAPTNSLFGGSTSAFGQQPQQASTGFGTGFGTQQQQPQQAGGLFSNSAFGNTANKSTFGTFGSTQPATSGFGTGGGFGNTQQNTQQSTGLFGNPQPATNTSAFGAFGNTNASKPIFGAPATTTTQPATTGFGTFGTQQPQQQTQQNPPNQQSSLFGNTTGGTIFGNTQQQPQQQQGAQQPTTGIFGNTAQPSGTGLFGNTLFGNNSNQLPGQQQQQQPQQNSQPNQQGQQGGFGLFNANKPATSTSLFSGGFGQPANNQTQQGGLFGSTFGQSTNQQSTNGGGLFGSKPPAPLGPSTSSGQSGGMFNSSFGGSTGLFNASANAQGAHGTLTASISQPIGSDLPIFSMLPPGPRLVNLEQSPKKKTGFFVDIPTRSPVPRVQLGYTPASSKLRGFGSSTTMTTTANGNPFAGSVSFTAGKPNALSLNKMDNRTGSVGPDSFLGRSSSPALGSGGRQSVKKVILDKKVEPSELFVKSGSPGPLRGKVTFSPALSVAAREKEAEKAAAIASNTLPTNSLDSPTPAPRIQRSPNRFSIQGSTDLVPVNGTNAASSAPSAELQRGDYWSKPDLATLKKVGYEQLSSLEGLVVGRIGYGEIHFLEPVDLTGLSKLGMLLGEIVRFEDKECSVYPESDDADKPPPGSGLNVRAQIELERCWAVDKGTREPIKDAAHPSAVRHLKRLKNMRDTHYENFDIGSGKWTFTVDHF